MKLAFALFLLAASAVFAQDYTPDPARTLGSINPHVTQDNAALTVCVAGWTRTIRPAPSYTSRLKAQQMRALHLPGSARDYEEDHLVQPYHGFFTCLTESSVVECQLVFLTNTGKWVVSFLVTDNAKSLGVEWFQAVGHRHYQDNLVTLRNVVIYFNTSDPDDCHNAPYRSSVAAGLPQRSGGKTVG